MASKSPHKRAEAQKPTRPASAAPLEDSKSVVVASSGLVEIISKAELAGLHEIAVAEPRSITRFQEEARGNVTLNEEVATACVYAIPFRDRRSGTTQMVKGPNARFAEMLQYSWRNCRVGGSPLQETETQVIARGWFIDAERNNGRWTDVPRSIVDHNGNRYSREVITRTMAAAVAIAKRNIVLESIPQALWQPLYKATLQVIAGDATTLASRRQDALKYLGNQGVPPDRVFATLGVRGIEDIGAEELTTLRALANAIRDGETTVEEAFFPKPAPAQGVAGAKQALQGQGEAQGEDPPQDVE